MPHTPDSPHHTSSDDSAPSPMHHPDEPMSGVEGPPRFGRLLLVLAAAVLLVGVLAIGVAAWLGP